ncbi:MAG: penicillin-binding protein 1A [Xanthomonadales bacterium]|nr:penicillin-binding protein 1A [Gammaproteobacteria bacterium]MBT8073822.1 penicillin-binding protein 1A [Gammaproteobacteria bacterium]NNK04669.1 penicillin-binding protein 1A [Xanthomonadales bacterium]NNL00170.1 penicillin-binding protein 1A [Xanthomonadales bacterium]
MKKVFRLIFRFSIVSAILGLATLAVIYLVVSKDLPDVETLRDVQLQVPLRVYTSDSRLISVFGEKRRIPVGIDEMPHHLVNAFIAGEDARFRVHPGVDYQGISRAVWTLATTGEKSIGGSTITQQLARNFFLTLEKTFTRKFKEIFLALKIERELSKDEILELYLNKILLGHRAYGVGAAADVYYGKSVGELSLAQCAMLAALPKAPSRINPITSPERAMERRDYVLGRMLELEYIDDVEYQQAKKERNTAFYHGATTEVSAPYLAEMVRKEMLARYGQSAYTAGFEVYTTIKSQFQTTANQAVTDGLEEYDHRHGYRGAEGHVELEESKTIEDWNEILRPYKPVAGLAPGLVTEVDEDLALVYLYSGQTIALTLDDLRWAKRFITRDRVGKEPESVAAVLQAGDIIRTRLRDSGSYELAQLPEPEALLISLSPYDGSIKALVGGYDYTRSKFNRVVQSRRQPGSGFKPFIYSAALAKGKTTASIVNDAPIVFSDAELERDWKPQNFEEKFYGPTRLREAMVNSRNVVSIRLLREVEIPYATEYISRFGFDPAELPDNLSMALGSASLIPISIARGYAVFANGGYLVDPYFIERIVDAKGTMLFAASPKVACSDCFTDEGTDSEPSDIPEPTEPSFRPLQIEAQEDLEVTHQDSAVVQNAVSKPSPAERVISEQNAFLIRSIMMDVVRRGTGKKAMELGRNDLAGKTGTTNEQRDAWFSGYNDEIVTSVWVGFDSHEPMGRNEVGGKAALPIWIDYMRAALQDVPDKAPEIPEGITRARIDPQTGLVARVGNNDAIMEVFSLGSLPPMEDAVEGDQSDAVTEEDPYDNF